MQLFIKKTFGSETINLIIPNEKMNNVMKIDKSGLFIKGVSETIKNEAKKERGRFLGILLDTLPSKHSPWWGRTEEVSKTSWRILQLTFFGLPRRLEDVFKA